MQSEEQIRIAERTLARQLEWIRAVETKLSILVAICVGMLGLLASRIPDEIESFWVVAGWTTLGGFFVTACLVFCGFATFPRTKHNNQSLLFFGTISDRNQAEFLNQFKAETDDKYLDDLLHQIYQNATIANTKYGFVKIAVQALLASVPCWLVSLYCLGAL